MDPRETQSASWFESPENSLPEFSAPRDELLAKIPITDADANLDLALEEIDQRIQVFQYGAFSESTSFPYLSTSDQKILFEWLRQLDDRELRALQTAEKEILLGEISLASIAWVRVWFAGIPGHERTVWFAEAEARAEFPGVLEEPDREYHDFVSRMTHRHNSLGAHISPLPPRCTERLSQIPRGQYDELTEVQAFQKVISETVRISKDPQELQLAYGLLIRELSENQSKFGIHLDAFMDSSITTIPEPSLDAHFKFQTLLGLVQDGFNLRPNRGYRDSGNYVANVGAVMVDLSAGGKRPLNAELEAERILLCAVFQGALEEVIHAWQIEYERRGTETETKNVIHVPEEGTSFRLLSLLAASFFQQFPGVLSRVDGKERMELIAEVDVVGKMVELYSEAEIPLERLALELFSYHVDFRRKFVLWLVDEGVVPREIVPDKFFDDSVRRALRLSELGEPLFVKDRRFLPKL